MNKKRSAPLHSHVAYSDPCSPKANPANCTLAIGDAIYNPEARNLRSKLWLFHYSTEEAIKNITEGCRQIHPTMEDSPWAHHGQGVYMTSLGPEVGRRKLTFNNYRTPWTKSRALFAKTEAFVAFRVEDLLGKVERVDNVGGRDIYIAQRWVVCTKCNKFVTGRVNKL